MEVICDVCDRDVPQPKRGVALRHEGCKRLRIDIDRIKRHLEQLAAGTHPARLGKKQLAQVRLELFTLASEVPRPRDKRGRYVSSRLSETYDREVRERKERAAERSGPTNSEGERADP